MPSWWKSSSSNSNAAESAGDGDDVDVVEAEQRRGWQEEFEDACSLSFEYRIYGFVLCFCLGWVLSFLSTAMLPQLATSPNKFAILYTEGNLLSLCSMMFLMGPCAQLRGMFSQVRCGATIIYLLALVLTVYAAFAVRMAVCVCVRVYFNLN